MIKNHAKISARLLLVFFFNAKIAACVYRIK